MKVSQFIKIIWQSTKMAFQELIDNPLRSLLSLLGITIGIFCIISILTGVDFLNTSIDKSIKELGQDVVYIQKFPWSFDDEEYPWWEYMKRPALTYENYKRLQQDLQQAEAVSFNCDFGQRHLRYNDKSIKSAAIMGTTSTLKDVMPMNLKYGRFFNSLEEKGANVAVIGRAISDELFGENTNPVGQFIRLDGRKVRVIGVISEEDNLIDIIDWSDNVLIPFEYGNALYPFSKNTYSFIPIKAKPDVSLDQLRSEIRGALRAIRRIRPIKEDDFAVNKVTTFLQAVQQTKQVLKVAGYLLGLFSLLIGGFGIANIMFVTVKERTRYIGIKKAIGAQKWVILTEFLIEAIILSLLGCFIGLFLVYILAQIASNLAGSEFSLTPENISLGLGISVFIGLISGLIPAIQAANMRPVDAIRS